MPGVAIPTLSRTFLYTSEDKEADFLLLESDATAFAALTTEAEKEAFVPAETTFNRLMREATEYATGITNPRTLNWVRNDFLWL